MNLRWIKMDSNEVTNAMARHQTDINGLPVEVSSWDVIVGLKEFIGNIEVCVFQIYVICRMHRRVVC